MASRDHLDRLFFRRLFQALPACVLCSFALAVMLPLIGCQGSGPSARSSAEVPVVTPPPPPRLTAPDDLCAQRLESICEAILMYCARNKSLPQKLNDLQAYAPKGVKLYYTCPVSGAPYIYNSQGVKVTGQPGLIILYDATAGHSGFRWAISQEVQANGSLIARPVAVADKLLNAKVE